MTARRLRADSDAAVGREHCQAVSLIVESDKTVFLIRRPFSVTLLIKRRNGGEQGEDGPHTITSFRDSISSRMGKELQFGENV